MQIQNFKNPLDGGAFIPVNVRTKFKHHFAMLHHKVLISKFRIHQFIDDIEDLADLMLCHPTKMDAYAVHVVFNFRACDILKSIFKKGSSLIKERSIFACNCALNRLICWRMDIESVGSSIKDLFKLDESCPIEDLISVNSMTRQN